MKAFESRDKFGLDSLNLVERPDPSAKLGQVLLRMKAFSVNYRDLLVVDGVGRWPPLSDGSRYLTEWASSRLREAASPE